ncbi:hypothetical protein CDEF62S_04717 [Castellaniella defragrans]
MGGLLFLALIYAALLSGIFACKSRLLRDIKSWQWISALSMLVLPYAYAFGTNGNYWQEGAHAAIFWLLGSLVAIGPIARASGGWMFSSPLALGAVAVTAVLLQIGISAPYRQPQPLWENTVVASVGPNKSRLVLSEGYAHYILEAEAAAADAGFKLGTPDEKI